jgi:hypothetical protein
MNSAKMLLGHQFQTGEPSIEVIQKNGKYSILLVVDAGYETEFAAKAVANEMWKPLLVAAMEELSGPDD